MKHFGWIVAAAVASMITACVYETPGYSPYVGGYEYANSQVIVAMPPPPMRYEVVPIIPADRFEREYWQPGYWQWNGAQHVWRDGRYSERPRHGSVWIAGQWTERRGGWAYQNGHWT
jgi:hypothetical protein